MKKRLVKKQMKKLVGYTIFGEPVYNCVNNPEYTGGSTPTEDYYKCEIHYIRKRHGAPLFLRNKWLALYMRVNWSKMIKTPFSKAVRMVMQKLDDFDLIYPRKTVEMVVAENWYNENSDEDNVSFITHVLQN